MYNSISELIGTAEKLNRKISEIILADQAVLLCKSEEELLNEMTEKLHIMMESVRTGMNSKLKSASGLVGGDAHKIIEASKKGKLVGGALFEIAIAKAVAVAEVNACMGKIVAAPTAGSCGIIPAVLLSVMEDKKFSEKDIAMTLFTAAGIGMVIANRSTLSGAEGGCQAECGSASAMAAAALVELIGGDTRMISNACAISLKNIMGLVCDPVAGLVEVPCIKRNAGGVANAMTAANLAIAGIESVIPADEVIDAMASVGRLMSITLKETAEGGLAATKTGRDIFGRLKNIK